LSPEIVLLLVLLGGVVAAVVFTIVIVAVVDFSDASARGEAEQERREGEESEHV